MNKYSVNKDNPETSICPICWEENACATAADPNAKTCWCQNEVFPEGIFVLVPKNLLRKTCICKTCLDNYKSDNKL